MAKVLLVEDDESLRLLYSKNLKAKNFEVETAVDGKDAFSKLKFFKPDLIILDIILPGINGIEILQILKGDAEFEKIPVIMLTSISEVNRIKECLDSGAKGYIMKDKRVSAEEIAEKVNLLLGLSG
ncbi:MAG TPA: response regulator [Thermodesulfobacteriota bacterium]